MIICSLSDRPSLSNITFKRIQEYCSIHEYETCFVHKSLDTTRHIAWSKILLLYALLHNYPNEKMVIWMDDDMYITDLKKPIEDFIPKFSNLLISEDPDVYTTLNTGIILIKNNKESLYFLEMIYNLGNVFISTKQNANWEQEIFNLVYDKVTQQYITKCEYGVLQNFYSNSHPKLQTDAFAIHVTGMALREKLIYIEKVITSQCKRISLKSLRYYCLTCDNAMKRTHMESEFSNCNIKLIESFSTFEKNQSGPLGFSKLFETACDDMKDNFKPFVVLEDDVSKYREFPDSIKIPNDTDILYIGLNINGLNVKTNLDHSQLLYKEVDDDIVRIYDMLGLHGIIICSMKGLLAIQKAMIEACHKNVIWDIHTAYLQRYYNVYALKEPLVYQDENFNGQQLITKISFDDIPHRTEIKEPLDLYHDHLEYSIISACEFEYSLNYRVNYLDNNFSKLGPIEKKIHIAWCDKNVIDSDLNIIKFGIRNIKELNPEYDIIISDNNEIELYIKNHISISDYTRIKDKHIVEKVDLWRLLKIYHEGGVYVDIDRLCNRSLDELIDQNTKCILPWYFNIDFSQDIMISCSKSPLFEEAIKDNLETRRLQNVDIYQNGPISYFRALTKQILGKSINNARTEGCLKSSDIRYINTILTNTKYLKVYSYENPPYQTLLYKGNDIDLKSEKKILYDMYNVKHWNNIL